MILLNIGVMMNMVRNSVSFISIWFDGVDCRFSVWCRMEKMMMIWVKLVISMMNVGMKFSVVMISRICRLIEYFCWFWLLVVMVIVEIDVGLVVSVGYGVSSRR